MALSFDLIIVGGGQSGCVVASRLHQAHPSLSIALIEAGPDQRADTNVTDVRAIASIGEGPLSFKYQSVPQLALHGRQVRTLGGRLLGGSSGINYTAWTRGHAADFDAWASIVQDDAWSYRALLPFFKRSEACPTSCDSTQHGFDGPIRLSCSNPDYPLREPVLNAFRSLGLEHNPDINSGDPNGIAEMFVSQFEGKREYAATRYDLTGVHIMPDSPVHKVICDSSGRATTVQLVDGTSIHASQEIILCAGALRTPQILMLSGIGPADELHRLGVQKLLDLPVGKNLHDHASVNLLWRLRHPERGLAMGSPNFNHVGATGNWFANAPAPDDILRDAATVDGTIFTPRARCDIEIPVTYVARVHPQGPLRHIKVDGTHITTGVCCLSPTSRGTLTLPSADPNETPIFDPQYFTTEHDKAVARAGMRIAMGAMESAPGREFIVGETPPEDMPGINSKSPDAQLNARIPPLANGWFHCAGTASMGSVVDSRCRVKGLKNLRVVDASIIPLPLTAHLQAAVYAIAEHAASFISKDL